MYRWQVCDRLIKGLLSLHLVNLLVLCDNFRSRKKKIWSLRLHWITYPACVQCYSSTETSGDHEHVDGQWYMLPGLIVPSLKDV